MKKTWVSTVLTAEWARPTDLRKCGKEAEKSKIERWWKTILTMNWSMLWMDWSWTMNNADNGMSSDGDGAIKPVHQCKCELAWQCQQKSAQTNKVKGKWGPKNKVRRWRKNWWYPRASRSIQKGEVTCGSWTSANPVEQPVQAVRIWEKIFPVLNKKRLQLRPEFLSNVQR